MSSSNSPKGNDWKALLSHVTTMRHTIVVRPVDDDDEADLFETKCIQCEDTIKAS